MALTNKQKLFVENYLVSLNATDAAIKAGYSEHTAAVVGHENLRKPNIASAIKEAMDKRAESVQIDAQWVLNKYIGIVERTETSDPQTARATLDSIAKHLGMFIDRKQVDMDARIEVVLNGEAKDWSE